MSIRILSILYNGLDPNYPVITYRDNSDTIKSVDLYTVQVTGNISQRLAKMIPIIQLAMDTVTPLSNFPADDPVVLADPAKPNEFWDGKGNLVTRQTILSSLTIDASNRIIPVISYV